METMKEKDAIDLQIEEFQRNPQKDIVRGKHGEILLDYPQTEDVDLYWEHYPGLIGWVFNWLQYEVDHMSPDEKAKLPHYTEEEEKAESRIFLRKLTGFFLIIIGFAVTITAGVALVY